MRIEPSTGKIAVACADQVVIYSPVVIYGHPLHWELVCTLSEKQSQALGWSSSDELFVGSDSLSLWHLVEENGGNINPRNIWTRKLALPIEHLEVSHDCNLIATASRGDRLVKVWKRASFDIDVTSFDYTYLRHPQPIVQLLWKQPVSTNQTIENTLYTVCTDRMMRIWMPYDSRESSNLQLWGSAAVDPSSCLIIHNSDLSRAVERSVSKRDSRPVTELGKRQPELCLSLSDKTLTAYCIENLSTPYKQERVLPQVDLLCQREVPARALHGAERLMLFAYTKSFTTNGNTNDNGTAVDSHEDLSVIAHDMKRGILFHFYVDLGQLLDPSSDGGFELHSVLTGHGKSVRSLIRASDGESLLSQSRFEENYVWKPVTLRSSTLLRRSSLIKGQIKSAVLVKGGSYVITLLEDSSLVLWDCRHKRIAKNLARMAITNTKTPKSFFLLPESSYDKVLHLVIVYDYSDISAYTITISPAKIEHLGDYGLMSSHTQEKLAIAVPVDPVGWRATVGEGLDMYQRDVMTTISTDGTIRNWTAVVDENAPSLQWLETATVETGLDDIAKAQVSSTHKVVTVDTKGTTLAIWDVRNKFLEFQETFDDSSPVSDIDWTSTPAGQNVLGVGFANHEVVLYCQLRFDYTNETPSWAPFRKVSISQYTTHLIGDSIWLKGGAFVMGAGNQIFIQDEKVDTTDEVTMNLLGSRVAIEELEGGTIFDVCAVLNGPLPLYHPQLLIQSLFAGKMGIVENILSRLLEQLKFSPQITSDLGIPNVFFEDLHVGQPNGSPSDERKALFRRRNSMVFESGFNIGTLEQLSEWIQKVSLPYLTRHQQITLASVIEALHETYNQRQSIDDCGGRYMLGYKLFKIHRGLQASMTMRDFNWALHSESQDVLLSLVERGATGTVLWPAVREVGLPYWLRTEKLKEVFEKLGRNYFSNDGKRDPVACSLYFLALRKKHILTGLWRTATSHPEQSKTMKLLANDFSEPRWRSAALKNAYALIGKHRYEYAAAFFLLGNALKDAVNVIVRYVDDISLAIAVARVYEGTDGPVMKWLIDTHILPKAQQEGDKWTLSWALWTIGDYKGAIQSLAFPKHSGDDETVKSFLGDDPVLAILYRHLRDNSLKTTNSGGRGNYEGLNLKHEFEFITKIAAIYSRMGCDVLALDLVRNWQFVHEESQKENGTTNGTVKSPTAPKLKPSQENLGSSAEINDNVMAKLKPVSAQAFQEPDMSAFSFGF